MLSTSWNEARLVHAHVCPIQQRLVIKISRFFGADEYSKELMDFFLRWLLAAPLPKQTADDEMLEQDRSEEECKVYLWTTPEKSVEVTVPSSLGSKTSSLIRS